MFPNKTEQRKRETEVLFNYKATLFLSLLCSIEIFIIGLVFVGHLLISEYYIFKVFQSSLYCILRKSEQFTNITFDKMLK